MSSINSRQRRTVAVCTIEHTIQARAFRERVAIVDDTQARHSSKIDRDISRSVVTDLQCLVQGLVANPERESRKCRRNDRQEISRDIQ